jgi:hypothetical protein
MNAEQSARAIAEALKPNASPSTVAKAAEHLRALGEQGYAGDQASWNAYQEQLYHLHSDVDVSTDSVRRWIASTVYALEEAQVPLVPVAEAIPADRFIEQINVDLQVPKAKTGMSMSQYMFDYMPLREDVDLYMQHHWYRSRGFYQLFADMSLRIGIETVGTLYHNLAEETGGDGSTPHPILFQALLKHMNLAFGYDAHPTWPEAHAYLNNRLRCVRHGEPAWGLALLYSIEYRTSGTHANILRLLKRMEFPDEACEFHRLHSVADEDHAKEMIPLIDRYVSTARTQQLFLSSYKYHLTLRGKYIRRVSEDMIGLKPGARPPNPIPAPTSA